MTSVASAPPRPPGRRVVGVLGGMGPAASAHFCLRLAQTTAARRDQDHLHVILDSDPSVPDRTAFLLGHGDDPVPALITMARRLAAAGADLLVMACNSASPFTAQVAGAVPAEMIDWAGESVGALIAASPPDPVVGLLATEGTAASGVYQRYLKENGATVILPEQPMQALVTAAIYDVKAGAPGLADGAIRCSMRPGASLRAARIPCSSPAPSFPCCSATPASSGRRPPPMRSTRWPPGPLRWPAGPCATRPAGRRATRATRRSAIRAAERGATRAAFRSSPRPPEEARPMGWSPKLIDLTRPMTRETIIEIADRIVAEDSPYNEVKLRFLRSRASRRWSGWRASGWPRVRVRPAQRRRGDPGELELGRLPAVRVRVLARLQRERAGQPVG
jgi:aspartate racemase